MKIRQEQGFAHKLALQRPQDLVAQGFAAHAGIPLNYWLLVDHLAGLGVQLLARFEVDARHLQVVAMNFVV
jgi:hypothetical protein